MQLPPASSSSPVVSVRNLALAAVAGLGITFALGCGGGSQSARVSADGTDPRSKTSYPLDGSLIRLTDARETLGVYDGHTGDPMTGRRFVAALRDADVVLLGETHDDPVAHRLQERIVREALAAGTGALSLEMLGRDDAAGVRRLNATADAGRPSAARVEDVLADTSLSRWAGWRRFYVPSVVAALDAGRPVVASNAPRDYVAAARTAGYGFLLGLDRRQRDLFDLPEDLAAYPAYRARFEAAMTGHAGVDVSDPARQPQAPTTLPASRPAAGESRMNARGPAASPVFLSMQAAATTTPASDGVEAMYRAQLVWDATMADSILAARSRAGAPVVHLVGGFHSDFDGGLTAMLRQTRRKVLTVSLVPADSNRLRPEDEGRADVVIYTGSPERFPRLTGDALDASPIQRRRPTTRETTRPAFRATTRPDPARETVRPTTRRNMNR